MADRKETPNVPADASAPVLLQFESAANVINRLRTQSLLLEQWQVIRSSKTKVDLVDANSILVQSMWLRPRAIRVVCDEYLTLVHLFV